MRKLSIERNEYLNYLLKLKDKQIIKIITGIRRAGKSTLLELYKNHLLKIGVKKEQIISLNFENPEHLKLENWENLYYFINDKLVNGEMYYIFLDEVQNISEFEKAVDGLYIKDNVDLYITGSNSYMLSSEIATLLSGRYMELHILPLSFKEYASCIDINNEQRCYESYINEGGFPYLTQLEHDSKLIHDYLDGVYSSVVLKDVIKKHNINDSLIFESVTNFLFCNIGQICSTKKISDTLNSNGRSNSVNTVENYIIFLTKAYLLYKVNRYDIKGKERLKTGYKYYVCDLGLRNYLLGKMDNRGCILENIVFLELKRKGYEIYIGKYNDLEVDFIAKNENGINYIQVCLSMRDENTKRRELRVLELIKDNYPKYIITQDYDTLSYNGIKQISVYDFLNGDTDL